MAIEIVDPFVWDGGVGRFGVPGRLNEIAYYRIGGLLGRYAINMGIAVYWGGDPVDVVQFLTPWFATKPTGGCNPGTGAGCGDAIQVSLGTLSITCQGGLSFTGYSYFENYSGIPFTVASDTSKPLLTAGAWNYIELKVALAGVYAKSAGQPCGLDPDPDPYGFITARVNKTECLRKEVSEGPYTYAIFAPCGCLFCQYFPVGIGEIRVYGDPYGDIQMHPDDFILGSFDMRDGEEAWIGDVRTTFLPAAGAGSSAEWTPVGAATNWEAASTDNDATSYNRTNQTGMRDSLALQASADTTPVVAAQPLIVARSQYGVGGGPPLKAFYRRGGVDYLTPTLSLATTFEQAGGAASVPTGGETVASLSAGEIGYTTE